MCGGRASYTRILLELTILTKMENQLDVQEVQETPEVVAPKADEKPVVTKVDDSISKKELEELRHRAEVSSQNYERAKKAEEELKKLKENLQDTEVLSEVDDEEVSKLRDDLNSIKAELDKANLLKVNPEMEGVWDKFEEFRANPDNKGMNISTAAKAFMVETGLSAPQRKGLEKTTGGDRIPISQGLSHEDAEKLRKSDYKKYVDMIKKGQLRIDD